MNKFFYRNWFLYYLLFFLLIGLLIYALLWSPDLRKYNDIINDLNNKLNQCEESKIVAQPVDQPVAEPAPVVDSETAIVNCNTEVKSGGEGETTTQHELGTQSGTVIIDCDLYEISDEINVYYDNQLVASSNGLVSDQLSLRFNYTAQQGKPTFCIVKVSAPYEGTSWEYQLNCPQ